MIFNLAGGNSGGGTSGWTNISSSFTKSSASVPATLTAYTNGDVVWIIGYTMQNVRWTTSAYLPKVNLVYFTGCDYSSKLAAYGTIEIDNGVANIDVSVPQDYADYGFSCFYVLA